MDQRTFDRLQALFADPARKVTHSPGVKGGKYTMGGGLTVCGGCGKPLISSMKRETLGRYQVTIGCLRRVHGPNPKHPQVKRVRRGVEVWQDSGRVAIDHDLLEEHVFGQVIARVENTELWKQLLTEKDPTTSNRLDVIDGLRRALRDQRERAQKAFVLGIMSEREAFAEVTRADAELDGLEKEASSLLRQPVLGEVLASGTLKNWREWAPGKRRAFLRLLIARVEVSEWPEGAARTTFRKKDETHSDFMERQRERLMSVVARRATIVWQWDL